LFGVAFGLTRMAEGARPADHLPRLQDETFLVRVPGSGARITMERFFSERKIQLKTGMEVGSNEAIKQGVQAGLGLGLLSRATIEQELELKRLAVLDVAEFPIMRHWYVVHRHGKRLSAAAEAFRGFLLNETSGPAPCVALITFRRLTNTASAHPVRYRPVRKMRGGYPPRGFSPRTLHLYRTEVISCAPPATAGTHSCRCFRTYATSPPD
jgi:hypothetical protein